MVDSTALVGSALVGSARVGALGTTAPEYLRSGGSWWKLVHDPQIGITEGQIRDWAARDAQEKADEAQVEAIRLAEVAATEADEALAAALGDLVTDKSNVFIQDVAPVAEMQRAGVLWIDTAPVTVDGQLVPGNVPRTWDAAAAQWVAVTDSAVIQASAEAAAAHEAAQAAADAAGEAMAEARYAPRTADRPPTQADGVDKPIGAGWHEYGETTNHLGVTKDRLVQTWMWTGTAWIRLDMDPQMIPVIRIGTGTFGDLTGDRIHVTELLTAAIAEIIELSVDHLTVVEGATITEAVAIAISGATLDYQEAYLHNLRVDGSAEIDLAVIGELASNIITSGLFRTAEEGQRLEIDSNGLIMWGVDPDGVEYEMVRLGPSGENLLTIGQSTISEEAVSAPRGEFDALLVAGQSVDELLFGLPRGVVGFAYEGMDSAWDGTGSEIVRLQAEAELLPNRRYSVTVDQHYVASRSASASSYVEQLRWSITGAEVTNDSSVLASVRHFLAATTSPETIPGMVGWIDTEENNAGFGTSPRLCTFGMTMRSAGGVDMRLIATSSYPLRVTIRDEGPTLRATGKSRFHIGTPSGGGASAPSPKPEVKRYKDIIWNAASYGGDTSNGEVYQGVLDPYGHRYGGWVFLPAMRSALAGSTIEKFEVYLENAHWWNGSGGTARLAPNVGGYKDTRGRSVDSANWPRYGGRWVTIPSDWYPYFADGTYRGISTYAPGTGLTFYGRFKGNATKFKVTYRK